MTKFTVDVPSDKHMDELVEKYLFYQHLCLEISCLHWDDCRTSVYYNDCKILDWATKLEIIALKEETYREFTDLWKSLVSGKCIS